MQLVVFSLQRETIFFQGALWNPPPWKRQQLLIISEAVCATEERMQNAFKNIWFPKGYLNTLADEECPTIQIICTKNQIVKPAYAETSLVRDHS